MLLSYKLILIQQDTLLLVMVHHRQYIQGTQGVEKWFDRLGNKFDRFIDGDVSSYTCSDVNYTSLEEYDEYGDLITFFTSCQTPLGTKTNLTTKVTQKN
jgi:hypothetical protein